MKDPIISYRGATAFLSELSNERTEQLQQQQGTQLVQYRGSKAQVPAHAAHAKKVQTISYRGATAEMAV